MKFQKIHQISKKFIKIHEIPENSSKYGIINGSESALVDQDSGPISRVVKVATFLRF